MSQLDQQIIIFKLYLYLNTFNIEHFLVHVKLNLNRAY